MTPYQFREIPGEFCYLIEKFVKQAPNMAQIEDNGKWDEKFGNFWRKSTRICRKMQDQDLRNDFHWAGKLSNLPAQF